MTDVAEPPPCVVSGKQLPPGDADLAIELLTEVAQRDR